MNISFSELKRDEQATFKLRELYSRYGYLRHKVSKFEEYDLYARNKSFLISENILTFTDTDGRLMALKPDVTLSIIKNLGRGDTGTYKLYYNENVYRTSAASDGFREIMQTGLECVGKLDTYAVCEVISLAQKSLDLMIEDNILDLSHMGFILGLIENIGVEGEDADALIALVESKNIPGIRAFCEKKGMAEPDIADVCRITSLYAPIDQALADIAPAVRGKKMKQAYDELCDICKLLSVCANAKKIYIDFSTVNDMNYYNGVTFKGFLKGLPDGILSGGRYDRLMSKMGKKVGAIGFAVYLDMLERLPRETEQYEVDTVLLYDDKTDLVSLASLADKLRGEGKTVKTELGEKTLCRYRQLLKLEEGGVVILETND